MPWIIAGGAVLGGLAGSLGGSAQAGAQDAATAEQRRQYDLNIQRQQPWQETGVGALGKLRTLMGLEGDPGAAMQMVRDQPGYQFRQEQGRLAVERSGAARGKQLSGQGFKELERYGQGFAESEYGNLFNRFSNLAGLGQTANQQMAGYGQDMVGQLGRQGTAQAGGAMTAAGGINQAIQGGLGNLMYQRRSDQLMDMFGSQQNYGQYSQGSGSPTDFLLDM